MTEIDHEDHSLPGLWRLRRIWYAAPLMGNSFMSWGIRQGDMPDLRRIRQDWRRRRGWGRLMYKREIFMANGRYEMCDVLVDQEQDKPFHERRMTCVTPDGREFIARPMYGTWGEERHWMRIESPKWRENTNASFRNTSMGMGWDTQGDRDFTTSSESSKYLKYCSIELEYIMTNEIG